MPPDVFAKKQNFFPVKKNAAVDAVSLVVRRRKFVQKFVPASPQVWGDQTDVPESFDWYNAGYIITWGPNVPQTRTPDAHFLTKVRYKGTKVVSIAPDYAESTAVADTWISLKTGSDAALGMEMEPARA